MVSEYQPWSVLRILFLPKFLFFSLYKTIWRFNSLPHDKILDQSKLKAFADNKINVNEKLKFGLGGVENIVEKGENSGYQHFLLFPLCFQKSSMGDM